MYGFGESIQRGFSGYVVFSGRAARSEFWWWTLFTFLVNIGTEIVDGVLAAGGVPPFLNAVVNLALLLPGIAVGVRRLHDMDHTGWWYLIILIPVIGIIALLIWFLFKGTEGDNRFGPDPLATAAVAA